jgi:UDP-N-acetylmuramyl pentapeptide phosphotransferase/UDP-N-acetylglucosamine-1-phosphate transferase
LRTLAASLLGFLRYNFSPASIFLGDCGSMLVGFLLGCYGVIWSEESATILGMMAPMTALALPLLDATLAIARRLIRGKPVFGADRGHIHHRLLDRGLTTRRAVFLLYGFCALAAVLLHGANGGTAPAWRAATLTYLCSIAPCAHGTEFSRKATPAFMPARISP